MIPKKTMNIFSFMLKLQYTMMPESFEKGGGVEDMQILAKSSYR